VTEQHGEFIGIDSHQLVIDTYRLLSTITCSYRLLSITIHRQLLLSIDLETMVQWSNAWTGKRWRPIIKQARGDNDDSDVEVVVRPNAWYDLCGGEFIQGNQKVSVHLMITIQKVTSNVQSFPPPVSRHLLTRRTVFFEDRVQYSTVYIPNVFCDGHLQLINCVGIVCQVHRDFLITLYNYCYINSF
jgi:hypothetical protein